MREILDRSRAGDERAVLARDVYIHRLRAEIAAMAAALGGVDALAFTGGVGENSTELRARALDGLEIPSISLDPERNQTPPADRPISDDQSETTALLIVSREDLQIARETRRVMSF
jgi:acetate kinase